MEVKIVHCSKEYFDIVKENLELMYLDNRNLNYSDFLIALLPDMQLVGFGRLRIYSSCAEVCSVGVLDLYRRKGIGKKLVQSLIDWHHQQNKNKALFVVTVIPEYFEKCGFKIVQNYCDEVKEKLNYCISALVVPEQYVVMTLVANSPINNR